MGDETESENPIRLPDHTQPSDYSDVQPKSYDPDFISQISSKMQVPHRIGVGSHIEDVKENGFAKDDFQNGVHFSGMNVPERIVLAGDNQHIGMRGNVPTDLPSTPEQSDSLSYVGLITPPRTLTLEERFPTVEEKLEEKRQNGHDAGPWSNNHIVANGSVSGPEPYDPGVSLHDSLLLNEENEATLLKTQVAKLTRRVQVIEQENQKRASREVVLYPVILGYFLWKVLSWFTRDR